MKMRKILMTTVYLMALVSTAFAADCTLFTEDQKMTLKGMIVQTARPEDDDSGKMYPSMAIVLYKPICLSTDPSDKRDFISICASALDSKKVGSSLSALRKWMGHHVVIVGKLGGAEYGAGADNNGN